MLHIGTRSFTPVPAQCGIHLQLDMIGPPHTRQVWRIDAVFVLQMDGEVVLPEGQTAEDGVTGDFRLLMEIPFASVNISVPVNAINPLAAGRAMT